VCPQAVQQQMRVLFERWGLPERLRVDNGWPWGVSSDLPTLWELWLVGLGVGVIHNRARRPQDNGKVERFHGLIEPWSQPETCPDYATWQERLDWVSEMQRERYPSMEGKRTRWEAFPGLASIRRPYTIAGEAEQWDIAKVKAYLAQGVWVRRVDKVGQITLYHDWYGVGRRYKGKSVYIRFDPKTTCWVGLDKDEAEIGRWPARQITRETLADLGIRYKAKDPAIACSGATS
jgi:hypothetical protein